MTADKQLKAYIDRVLRLKEEQDTLGQDIRDVYAEAKGDGYDKTVMGKLVAHLRKIEKSGASEVSDAIEMFEFYLNAYERASGTAVATHTHEEKSERVDPLTGEFLDEAPRADGGANIVTKHIEIATILAQAEADRADAGEDMDGSIATNEGGENVESSAERAGLEGGPVFDIPEPSGPEAERATYSPEEANEMDRDTEGSLKAGSTPAENAREATATGAALGSVTHAEAGESPAPSFLAKPPSPLRPHCQRPEMCAGVGRTHCHTCAKAMRERAPEEELA